MTAWSLWQKMPPRYQLTTRSQQEMEEPEVYIDERPRTPRTPRSVRSPRPQGDTRAGRTSPRAYIAGTHTQRDPQNSNPPNTRRLLFPGRKSGYIDHIKTQKRVNSARIKLATNPSTVTCPPAQRAKTAPLNSPRSADGSISPRPGTLSQPQSRGHSEYLKNDNSNTGEFSTKIDLSANGIGLEDDQTSSGTSSTSYKEIPPRKFVVRETDEGTLYIDNGKVVFFRKSRHNGTQLVKGNGTTSSDKGGFLASIRREYLSKPRYLATSMKTHGRTTTNEERIIQRERLNYNKKVGHILDYYSNDDEDQISMDDLSRYTVSNRQKSWRHTTPDTRVLSPRVRKIHLEESQRRRPVSPQYDFIDDPTAYLKLSSQSKLHDRKFFLRTPGFRMLIPGAQGYMGADLEDNCRCGMCRIEMQISLLAQLGIHFPVPEVISGTNDAMQSVKPPEPDKQTESKTVQTEIDKQETDTKSKTCSDEKNKSAEVANRTEQTLTITLPEMTSERESTDLSTRESARETYRSVPGD